MHPQGVGRWVPGDKAATLPLAALRSARSSPILLICLCRCADQRLGWRFVASL